ncbi:MAG: hypothetical protein ABSA46_19535 [Thermodesulfovibrionales bacterium]|jgi:uncharacterized protein (TIGR04562 family)
MPGFRISTDGQEARLGDYRLDMKQSSSAQELYHDIFGSVLDRTEMTPFLLLRAGDYGAALQRATKMMGNRGFDTLHNELQVSERERAHKYIDQVYKYFLNFMFPFFQNQLERLIALDSDNASLYRNCLGTIGEVELILKDADFRHIVNEDPRHLFLLASSRKYPHVFYGYKGKQMDFPVAWQQAACSVLKMAHLIKSIEEDSQDIDDYAELGFFLEMQGRSLNDLYHYDWEHPGHLPEGESAQRAFVKISTFFHKLKESMTFDPKKGCLVFNSGDGVEVDIIEIKARLKSPESMVTKLGKDVEGEAYDIRDILAITFILKSRDDTLKLFHALQKRGVILQENTESHSITQTLFDDPESMREAVQRLMVSLSQSEGNNEMPDEQGLLAHAKEFYEALSVNAAKNLHSSEGHRKFQCKINFSLPIHRTAETNEIIIPGTPAYEKRGLIKKKTHQHTLAVELRISDEQSWRTSEQKGDSHHDAYKFRQLISLMNRVFKDVFHFRKESITQLREDQVRLFH